MVERIYVKHGIFISSFRVFIKKIKCFYAMPFQMSEFQVSTTHTVYGSDRGPYHNHHHHQVGINFINS